MNTQFGIVTSPVITVATSTKIPAVGAVYRPTV